MRFKNRYIAFQMMTDPKHKRVVHEFIGPGTIANAIKASIQANFGDFGTAAMSNLTVKYYSAMTGVGIVRVARDELKRCWAAISLVAEISGVKCVLRTIKQAQINTIKHNQKLLLKLRSSSQIDDIRYQAQLKQADKTIMELDL
ncbi:hypothetical protein CcCBS67573_g08074 [Chytriomyces confervae]|uniref:Ribonuclease P/MRP protein subunit POP5 n=1 Tax=Chytriomyces confervae TaxID=246404 RepID=A0A507EQM7_9FUNG|nr:hypothetical protein CcCBS67573_g08074 [Chytriomyces confervae]